MLIDEKILTFNQIRKYVKNAIRQAVLKGDFFTPEMHRIDFRGKNLGGVLTAKQKTAIKNGTFADLWLGDYWVINDIKWRIVDFDYWWNCGDSPFIKHHLVVMPDANLAGNKQMNPTNTVNGGYVGSLMRTSNINAAKAMCMAAFGENILSHRELLVNEVADSKPSSVQWVDSTIELPNEYMIYGHSCFSPSCDGSFSTTSYLIFPFSNTIDKTQLSLFAVAPKFIVTRQYYWLRDVVSRLHFAAVYNTGEIGYAGASHTSIGIRPVFPVGVPD